MLTNHMNTPPQGCIFGLVREGRKTKEGNISFGGGRLSVNICDFAVSAIVLPPSTLTETKGKSTVQSDKHKYHLANK